METPQKALPEALRFISSHFMDEVLRVELVDIVTLALYAVLAGAYLLVVPAALLFYLKSRWYVASSVERLLMYFMVFMFFPGLLLLSPFINFRPQRQGT